MRTQTAKPVAPDAGAKQSSELVVKPAATTPDGYTPLREIRIGPHAGRIERAGSVPRGRLFDVTGWFGIIAFVILPFVAGTLYFGWIAFDRYVSEVAFMVKRADQSDTRRLPRGVGETGGLKSAAGLQSGDRESQAILTFLKSSDAMLAADRAVNLRRAFGNEDIDALSRFPGPLLRDTDYHLNRYLGRRVEAEFLPETGITTLSVEAFRPEDARAIAEAFLVGAERIVNQMNERTQRDAADVARDQVERTFKDYRAAQETLTAFRLRERMTDPDKMSALILTTISTLIARKVELQALLSDSLKGAPQSPQIGVLRTQIRTVEEQIQAEQRKLAGNDGAMAPKLAEYAELVLRQSVAERLYTAALTDAENVRLDALRERVYIQRVSGPTLPDYALQPRRLLMILLVAALSLCALVILRHFVRDSRAHGAP